MKKAKQSAGRERQTRIKRVFKEYTNINDAYSDIRSQMESYFDKWNRDNPAKAIKALDLYIMAYFHYCIPDVLKPANLFSDTKKPQERFKKILYPFLESPISLLTENKYVDILSNSKNLDIFLRRLTASRTDNPKEKPYVIPGSEATFKNLYDAGYIKSGDVIILRARKTDYEATVNKAGKVDLKVGGKVQSFDSVTEAGIKGIGYPGFNQWNTSRLIDARGQLILLDEFRKRFEIDNPFPAHFDSPISKQCPVVESPQSDTAVEKDDEFYEGSIYRISKEARERDAKARKACIAHHKAKCFICEFDFGNIYGPDADGFIHVHHREMLSKSSAKRKVDPINDLVPLCPNCHSVVHLRKDSYDVDDVRAMVKNQRSKIKI